MQLVIKNVETRDTKNDKNKNTGKPYTLNEFRVSGSLDGAEGTFTLKAFGASNNNPPVGVPIEVTASEFRGRKEYLAAAFPAGGAACTAPQATAATGQASFVAARNILRHHFLLVVPHALRRRLRLLPVAAIGLVVRPCRTRSRNTRRCSVTPLASLPCW